MIAEPDLKFTLPLSPKFSQSARFFASIESSSDSMCGANNSMLAGFRFINDLSPNC